jgi:hypothetical protein
MISIPLDHYIFEKKEKENCDFLFENKQLSYENSGL